MRQMLIIVPDKLEVLSSHGASVVPEGDTFLCEYQGFKVRIENPAGTIRQGVDETGKAWRTEFHYSYGEIVGSMGVDGDPVDVYLGENEAGANEVYIVRQMKRKRWDEFDEDKCFLGFDSMEAAKEAYLAHYDDPRFFGSIVAMPLEEFRAKVKATGKQANPDMIKSQVSAYTRKDGAFVPAHNDKRVSWADKARNHEKHTIDMFNGKTQHEQEHERAASEHADMLHEAAHAHRDKLGVNESSFDRMMERPRAYTDHIEKHAVPHMHPDWQGKYHAAKGKAPQYQAPMRKAIFLLLKSHIAGYTRSDGVYVKPHDDKRTKKTQQLPKFKIKRADLDGVMGDMFAGQHGDEGAYTMPKKEAIKEHERLVNVLSSSSHEDDKREAKEQAKELAEMKGEDKPAIKEPWELSREGWVDQEIANSDYAEEYEKDKELRDDYASTIRPEWDKRIKERAKHGRISDAALDDIVARLGVNALGAFRGSSEKGVAGYRVKETRMWDKTYSQLVKMQKDGKFGAGFRGKQTNSSALTLKEAHRNEIRQALKEDKDVPESVLKDYPELMQKDNPTPVKAKIKSVSNKPLDESSLAADNKVSQKSSNGENMSSNESNHTATTSHIRSISEYAIRKLNQGDTLKDTKSSYLQYQFIERADYLAEKEKISKSELAVAFEKLNAAKTKKEFISIATELSKPVH